MNRKEGNRSFIIVLIRKWASFIWHYVKSYCQFCQKWPIVAHTCIYVYEIEWRIKSLYWVDRIGELSVLCVINMQEGEEEFTFQVFVGTNVNGCQLGRGYFEVEKGIRGMRFWERLLIILKVWMGTYGRVPVTATFRSNDLRGPSFSMVFFHVSSYNIMIFLSSWLLC